MSAAAEPGVGAAPVAASAEPIVCDDNVGSEKYQQSELAEGVVAT